MTRKAMRPRDVANEIATCIKEGNIDTIVDFFHPDYLMSFPPTETPKTGLDTVKEVFSSFIASRSTLTSNATGEIINNDIALVQAEWHIKDHTGAIINEGNATEVFKQREDGSWVYYIDCPMGLPSLKK